MHPHPAPPSSAHTTPRDPGIDTLRGLAIVLVVLHHIAIRFPLKGTALAQWLPKPLRYALTTMGYEAVFVFFVVSGFLTAGNSLRRWGSLQAIDARRFYRQRFARIVPGLLAVVLVLSGMHLAGVPDFVIDGPGQSLPRAAAAALGLHLNWYEGATGYLPGAWDVLWSLSIEEAFYLAFPLLCLGLRPAGVLAAFLALLVLAMPWLRAMGGINEIWLEKSYGPGLSAIALGVLAACAAHERLVSQALALVLGLAGLGGLLSVLLAEGWLWPRLGHGVMLLLAGASAALLLACDAARRHGVSLALPGLGWLRAWGRLSYEIYLTHMFVVLAAVALARHWQAPPAHAPLWYLPVLAVSWGLGAVVARTFTGPCERWLRTFTPQPASPGPGLHPWPGTSRGPRP